MSNYVIDASMGCVDGLLCVCPVETDDDGNIISIVTGLNLFGFVPDGGKILAVVHEDGQAAVEDFCNQFAAEIAALRGSDERDRSDAQPRAAR